MSIVDVDEAGQDLYSLSSGPSQAVHTEMSTLKNFVRSKVVFKIAEKVPHYGSSSRRHSVEG